jgi:hypothetical protein
MLLHRVRQFVLEFEFGHERCGRFRTLSIHQQMMFSKRLENGWRRISFRFFVREKIVLLCFFGLLLVVDEVPDYLLDWIEPHAEESAHLREAVDVLRHVAVLVVADELEERRCEVVAVVPKWVIVVPNPELPEVFYYFVYFA